MLARSWWKCYYAADVDEAERRMDIYIAGNLVSHLQFAFGSGREAVGNEMEGRARRKNKRKETVTARITAKWRNSRILTEVVIDKDAQIGAKSEHGTIDYVFKYFVAKLFIKGVIREWNGVT